MISRQLLATIYSYLRVSFPMQLRCKITANVLVFRNRSLVLPQRLKHVKHKWVTLESESSWKKVQTRTDTIRSSRPKKSKKKINKIHFTVGEKTQIMWLIVISLDHLKTFKQNWSKEVFEMDLFINRMAAIRLCEQMSREERKKNTGCQTPNRFTQLHQWVKECIRRIDVELISSFHFRLLILRSEGAEQESSGWKETNVSLAHILTLSKDKTILWFSLTLQFWALLMRKMLTRDLRYTCLSTRCYWNQYKLSGAVFSVWEIFDRLMKYNKMYSNCFSLYSCVRWKQLSLIEFTRFCLVIGYSFAVDMWQMIFCYLFLAERSEQSESVPKWR